ncbi:DUF1292 domain-containing protein [Clostridium sardiniense]|uniref:DUF1292 domain-containing protein n=1 Tax=Clostridium sardiniense TaxID=29369 RepID=A0ABS7KZH5_CLOSR|nr:DUF1292 domain-containing protein [Clostridium sardiniense]MBY0756169.1 DUF1292 domain-containing protein [Clostridium sardiniense]MDQ0458888.1 ABC-type Zn2+ transport system substrate-binding protein/surface adhesin [Clostridium sardiniense]
MDKELNKCGCGNHEHNEGHECCGGHGHDHGHDHECGCGEDHHEHFVVDLVDDEGNTISCPIIDAFEFEGNEYVLAKNMEDESVYLFRTSEENEELVVPEEDEFERVSTYYNETLVEE